MTQYGSPTESGDFEVVNGRWVSTFNGAPASPTELRAIGADLEARGFIPRHKLAGNCFVCGFEPHGENSHRFWSNEDARKHFADEDRGQVVPAKSMSAVETLDPREAVYQ